MRILALTPSLSLAAAAPADERSYMLTGFDRLRVEGPFEIEVAPGSPRAAASGDRRTLDQLSIRVDAGTLMINSGAGGTARPEGTFRIRVSAPALRMATVTDGAKVRIAALRADRLDLSVNAGSSPDVASLSTTELRATLTGESAMTLAGTATRLRVRNLGTGSSGAPLLIAEDADLVTQGDRGIRVHVRYTAHATALGDGAILITGQPRCTTKGSGPITCAGTKPR